MKTRYEAEIDGIPMSSVSPSIYVIDIREEAPGVMRTTARYPTGDGLRLLRTARESLRVTVLFEIHERDVRRRADVLERVGKWARGRFLRVNYRPEQRLCVVLEAQPSLASALQWTQPLAVTFAAYAVPFWEDAAATRVEVVNNRSVTAYVRGTARAALVEATMENTGTAAITRPALSVGDTRIAFSDISLPAKGKLALAYGEGRLLTAKIGGTSVLARRTPDSDDDLLAPCGQRVTFAVGGAGAGSRTVFSVRGWYL